MTKNQRVDHKFTFLFFFIYFLPLFQAAAQAPEMELQRADSLFDQKEYTESLRIYQELFQLHWVASPAMLIRMAYIEEGLGDYSQALFYLNEYFIQTNDELVLSKMKELAEAHNLKGYAYDDYDLLQNFFRQYRYLTIFSVLGLAVAGLFIFALRRKKYAERPYGIGGFYLVIMLILFFLINYSDIDRRAIIVYDHSYIMSGPSAGAEVIYISEKGHRVPVEKREDIWLEILWEGQKAYIRQADVELLHN